jgi:hypothetical protein
MNRPLGKHRCKWEDNIEVNLKDRNRVIGKLLTEMQKKIKRKINIRTTKQK